MVNGNLADCYTYAPVPSSQRQGYALAQDVASAARLFLGELWYDTTQGLPYFQEVLGYLPSLQFLKSQFVAAALTVPGVATAVCFLTGLGAVARSLGGQIQITDSSGQMVGYVETTGIQDNGAPWYVNGAINGANQ